MKQALTERRVTSLSFEQELKTGFPIRHSRKHYCHWWNIARFSPAAFSYHMSGECFIYMGVKYQIVYADGFNAESILGVSSVGASMRAFTNNNGETFYICVVTEWRGDKK